MAKKVYVPSRKIRPEKERLLEKIVVTEPGCWEWTGCVNEATGYGGFSFRGGRTTAHRASYTLWIGEIEDGMEIDHLCRNRRCVNPWHLESVTRLENVRRGEAGKVQREKTHCPQGHEYDEVNTRWYQGRRYCRACMPAHRERWSRKMEALPNGK